MIDPAKQRTQKEGIIRHASQIEVYQWITESWEAVSAECIQNGFRRALNENVEDDYDSKEDMNSSDNDITDFEKLPEELHNALDQFQIISDEKFDGFDEQ